LRGVGGRRAKHPEVPEITRRRSPVVSSAQGRLGRQAGHGLPASPHVPRGTRWQRSRCPPGKPSLGRPRARPESSGAPRGLEPPEELDGAGVGAAGTSSFDRFTFTHRTIVGRLVRLGYALSSRAGARIAFEETFELPPSLGPLARADDPAIAHVLRGLHITAGTSYWKTFIPG